MRRWVLVVVGGWMLACSGAVMTDGAPPDDEPVDDGDGDDEDEDDEVVEAKDPLPDVEPDEEERGDCVASSWEDSDPLLVAEQAKGGTVEVDASPNRFVETVVMKNGMMVRVTRGGCAHAGETWEISPAPKGPVAKVFTKVLKNVERASDDDSGIDMCMSDMPDPPPKNGWSAGDAHCSWSKEGSVLALTYDFAL